jgi:RNA recognition motif-containing protein
LSLNNCELKSQRIRVYISKPPELSSETDQRTVFVRNIAFDVTEKDLRQTFSTAGPVEEVRLIRDPKSGRPKGFAYV